MADFIGTLPAKLEDIIAAVERDFPLPSTFLFGNCDCGRPEGNYRAMVRCRNTNADTTIHQLTLGPDGFKTRPIDTMEGWNEYFAHGRSLTEALQRAYGLALQGDHTS